MLTIFEEFGFAEFQKKIGEPSALIRRDCGVAEVVNVRDFQREFAEPWGLLTCACLSLSLSVLSDFGEIVCFSLPILFDATSAIEIFRMGMVCFVLKWSWVANKFNWFGVDQRGKKYLSKKGEKIKVKVIILAPQEKKKCNNFGLEKSLNF